MNTIFNGIKRLTSFTSNKNNNQKTKTFNHLKTLTNQSSNLSNFSNKKKTNLTKSKKDTYTIIDYPIKNQNYGEFIGSSPKRAAHKAFSKLAKLSNLNNKSEDLLVFSIKNTRTNKIYKYIGKRIKLSEPRKVMRNGKEIIYKYVNTVGKYKKELNLIK